MGLVLEQLLLLLEDLIEEGLGACPSPPGQRPLKPEPKEEQERLPVADTRGALPVGYLDGGPVVIVGVGVSDQLGKRPLAGCLLSTEQDALGPDERSRRCR